MKLEVVRKMFEKVSAEPDNVTREVEKVTTKRGIVRRQEEFRSRKA